MQLHGLVQAQIGPFWLPALGVGIGPNEALADALAAQGVAVAVHEWRGLGASDRRAARGCDWGCQDLLDIDIAAGLDAARERFPGLRWYLGDHSLGRQFALIHAAMTQTARHADEFDGVPSRNGVRQACRASRLRKPAAVAAAFAAWRRNDR